MKVHKAKKKNSIQSKASLGQEAECDEDEVFNVYHQRVIGEKIASYVAYVKTEKENVALQIDTGASVSILNSCCNSPVNLLPILSKLKELLRVPNTSTWIYYKGLLL